MIGGIAALAAKIARQLAWDADAACDLGEVREIATDATEADVLTALGVAIADGRVEWVDGYYRARVRG